MVSLKTSNWSLDGVECVLFDKDGTFIDLHYFWGKMTELRALEVIKTFNLNNEYFEKICAILGFDLKTKKMLPDGITAMYSRKRIIEIFKTELETFNIFTREELIEEIFDNVSEAFYNDIKKYTKPIPEAIDFIKNLRTKGIKLGIVTSDSVKSTILTIEQFKWNDYFDVVIGRESSKFIKETGEPTKLALKLLNANPQTTVMIGDAPIDSISAKNAGILNTILVATGQINKSKLFENSKYVVENLDEILIY